MARPTNVPGGPPLILVLVVPVAVLARAADDDALGLDGHDHRAVARPVLGVDGVVLDGGVEPEAVALVAVVEGALERLRLAAPAAAAAPAAPAALRLVLVVGVLVFVRLVLGGRLVGLLLGLERRGHERVVLGAQVELLGRRRPRALLGAGRGVV